MAEKAGQVINRVKHYRQQAKLSQAALAERVGIKRQGIYDIESGKYLPNTGVALKLARHLGCRVEDLFYEETGPADSPVVMGENGAEKDARVSVIRVRDRLVAYPVDGKFSFSTGLLPADGVLEDSRIRFFGPDPDLDNTIMLMGCDPAFPLLAAHASRVDPKLRVICRFASTHSAMARPGGRENPSGRRSFAQPPGPGGQRGPGQGKSGPDRCHGYGVFDHGGGADGGKGQSV